MEKDKCYDTKCPDHREFKSYWQIGSELYRVCKEIYTLS